MLEFSKPKYVRIQQTEISWNSANQNMLEFSKAKMLEFSKPKYVGIQQTKIY